MSLSEARTELFALCEHMSDEAYAALEAPDLTLTAKGFWRGQKSAAKAIARAMSDVFRDLASRQDGSAGNDGAAMRHTLSVQATDKSDRAEGVAALQQQQDVADLIAWHTRERHAWLNVRASNEPGYTEQKAKFHETAVATLRGLHA